MKINEIVRKLRKEKKMTQQEVADKVHLTVQAINQYESGKRKIESETLVSLLNSMGYDMSIIKKFVDKEVFAIHWELTLYVDHDNEYGRMYTDFSGAKEITEEKYKKIKVLIEEKDFIGAAKLLEKETKNIPNQGDIWDYESWTEFLLATTIKLEEEIQAKTEKEIEDGDYESYLENSFLTLKKCPLSEIKKVKPRFERMYFY